MGAFFFDVYGDQILNYFHAHETFEDVKAKYAAHGILIILLAGFTPIPYKIFTIVSGVLGIAFIPFVLLSFIGRGGRFFLVAGLVKLGGDKLEETIHKKVELIGWVSLLIVLIAGTAYYYLR